MITDNVGLIIPAWIASGALNATGSFYLFGATPANGASAHHYRSAILSWQWAGTSTPNGTFGLEGNNQTGLSTETWYPLYIDANKAYGNVNNATYAHAGGNTVAVNSAVAGYLMAILDTIPPFLRLTWTRTSGGAATGLTAAQATLRPM